MGWGRQTLSTHTRRFFRLGQANSLPHTRRILGWDRAILGGAGEFFTTRRVGFFGTWRFVLGVGRANFLLMVRWVFLLIVRWVILCANGRLVLQKIREFWARVWFV